MTSTSDTMGRTPSVAAASPAGGVRPFFWSVRRELWENRAIYIAPAVVGAVVVAAVLLAVFSRGSIVVYRSGPAVIRAGGDVIKLSGRPAMGSVMLAPFLVPAAGRSPSPGS